MALLPGAPKALDIIHQHWPPRVTFDFANATSAQKEVLARENAHCGKSFPASTREWLTRYVPEPVELKPARPEH